MTPAVRASVRGWTRRTVRFELRRDETVWSLAITYQHGLARPKLDEAAAAKRLHMHKNIGSLRAAG